MPHLVKSVLSTYAFTDVSETSNNGDLSGKHNISGTLDTIDQRFAASVVVIEFGLCDGIVDVDRGNLEFTITEHLVQVVNTGSGLLGQALDVCKTLMRLSKRCRTEKTLTLEVLRVLLVDQAGQVTSIIKDHVQRLAVGESGEGLFDTPKVFLLGLSLPSKDWNAGRGNPDCGR